MLVPGRGPTAAVLDKLECAAVIIAPGAQSSGFGRPSLVSPLDEKSGELSGVSDPHADTVITCLAVPGMLIVMALLSPV
jgi:hypothetical protein